MRSWSSSWSGGCGRYEVRAVRSVMRRTATGTAVWLSLAGPGVVSAQVNSQAAPGPEAMTATAPIRCWWKSGKSVVYIGERFPLTLTCSVVDTAALRVVADQSRLDPTAVQFSPFDVVAGTRHPDIEAGPRRLFQYQYSLRVIAEDLFGREVTIPAFDIFYRVQNTAEDGAAIESMERVYRLPPLPVRVMALVSPQAVDIRDAPADTFADMQSRRFRGNVAFAMAALLFSAGLGCLVVASGGAIRRYRTPTPHAARLLSQDGVLRHAMRELRQVQRDARQDGWTRNLAGQALAAVRLGIAIALGERPTQVVVDDETAGREGALIVRSGIIRPKRLMVSASVTAEALAPGLEQRDGERPAAAVRLRTRALLDDFGSTLAVFTAARYGQHEPVAREALDGALTDALALLQRLGAQRAWRTRASDAVARAMVKRRAWAR